MLPAPATGLAAAQWGDTAIALPADAPAGLVDVLDGKGGIAVELGVEMGTGTLQALTIEQPERGAE